MWERNGQRNTMGLGSIKHVSLLEARDEAEEARRTVRKGGDPIVARNKRRAGAMTFGEAANTASFDHLGVMPTKQQIEKGEGQ